MPRSWRASIFGVSLFASIYFYSNILYNMILIKEILKNNKFMGNILFLARVSVTLMGYRCERCVHEWVPRYFQAEPRVCPKCKSPYWNRPRATQGATMTYEIFKTKIHDTLRSSGEPLTWTEIRTLSQLP